VTFETAKKLAVTVLVIFLLISFWSNPAGSADAFGDFVGNVGGFFSSVIDKGAQFVKALA
jgi:hypothetical protein